VLKDCFLPRRIAAMGRQRTFDGTPSFLQHFSKIRVNFPPFVGGLINSVFDVVVDATIGPDGRRTIFG